jgi:hypothetical protein
MLHTPWSSILLEKLTGSQVPKKFPAFYGTRSFITAFTRPLSVHTLSQINPADTLQIFFRDRKHFKGAEATNILGKIPSEIL